MRAVLMYGAGDVRVETVPDPHIVDTTDAIVRVVAGCVCGSDLWPYKSMPASRHGTRMGHEFVGIVEETGSDVTDIAEGDFVIAAFLASDGTCEFCQQGLQTSCRRRIHWGSEGVDAGQGERVRVPYASGTLVVVPAGFDEALIPSLLSLSDVMSTGHHAAVKGRIRPGNSVAVIGDGAVGLSAVLASAMLGADQIILMGHHQARTDLGREFGATNVVAERDEGIAKVKELTSADGANVVIEAVGLKSSTETAFAIVRDGGVVSRVGVPQFNDIPFSSDDFTRNITVTGGIAPVRAYIPELLVKVLNGTIQPGKVFDRTVNLDGVPAAYRAMEDRTALKILIRP